jgi:predicted permease
VRRLLVVGQVALSLVLLTGAGLFVRTLRNLETQQLGVSTDRLLLVWALPGQSGHRGISLASYWSLLGDRLAAMPGVEAATATREGWFSGAPSGTPPINVAGGAPAPNGGVRGDGSMTVSPSYFATVGQRLLRGRDFARWDTDSTPRVAIVSESMARRLFGRGTEAAVGRRIAIGAGRTPATYEIVGVVSDARVNSPREPGAAVIYYPYTQQSESRLSRLCLVVRTAGDPARVAASVQRELRDVDPTLPVVRIDTMRDQLDDLLARDRLISQLSAFFALVAVLLACVGLYGVMSYRAARRTNEIGIRMALGATRASVLGSVLREAMLLVTSGVVIGLPLTFAATRFVATRLYGVSAIDPLTMTAATGLMLGVAAVAGFLPARRAARVDPVVALRYE